MLQEIASIKVKEVNKYKYVLEELEDKRPLEALNIVNAFIEGKAGIKEMEKAELQSSIASEIIYCDTGYSDLYKIVCNVVRAADIGDTDI